MQKKSQNEHKNARFVSKMQKKSQSGHKNADFVSEVQEKAKNTGKIAGSRKKHKMQEKSQNWQGDNKNHVPKETS